MDGKTKSTIIHPSHKQALHRLNRIQGQLKGISSMIENRVYCVDILVQIKAASSALKSLEAMILEKHLMMCVSDALKSRKKKVIDAKIKELMDLFKRNSK